MLYSQFYMETANALPQENNPTSNQMYSLWQPSSQDEQSSNQGHQQDLRNQEQQNEQQQSSEMEVTQRVSSVEVKREVIASSPAPGGVGPPIQYKAVQVDSQRHQAEQNPGGFSQSSVQMSGTGRPQFHEQDRMLNQPSDTQSSTGQRFSNQPAQMQEQVATSANRAKQIPFGCLLPIILPELDKDRAMQLQTLYSKLRRNEIPKEGFVRHMRSLVGDQMLRLAVVKMTAKGNRNPETGPNQFQVQSQSPMQQQQQQHLRPPTTTAAQFSDPYSFGQLHQKSQNTPLVTLSSRGPPSIMQPVKDAGSQIVDNTALKSREVEHRADSHAISMQGLTPQQQQHLHFSQGSFPMYGAGSYHPYTGSNVSTSSTMIKPQPHDPQIRQVQLHQGFGSSNAADGTGQAVTTTNVPKVERQNSFSDPKRLLGATMPNMAATSSMQHSAAPWQPMGSKEQKTGGLPSMGYVKQEPVDQAHEKQPKPPSFSSQGPSHLGAVQVEQGTSGDELSDRQHPGAAFPSSTRTPTMATSNPVSTHMAASADNVLQVGPPPQSISANPTGATGGNTKASAKKPSGGQKKPLDAYASSSPVPSKKQKVSGDLENQRIEELNDVTAVSGVNLREEEEQLFSGPKDDSRVSEASRKAVQEEEDRLILQKIPLQKKLAEIMTKCGLKNLSNDVERCLSLCVEERLRGLISSLIRVSKQRVDSEKSRHSTVVTSDVREQILMINQKAKEEWEKKQAEAEKLRKSNEPDSNGGVDGDKEKDDRNGKSLKTNKEEDDKMRTTAANVAARAAVGGDDMLSKWQLMAQARQKRDGGPETASTSQAGKDANRPSPTSSSVVNNNVKDNNRGGAGKKDQSAVPAPGTARQFGRSQGTLLPLRAARSISVKDVIAVLEREPQMAKSTIIYRLYAKACSDTTTE